MSAKGPAGTTWFAEHSGLALFAVGCVVVLAAVLGPPRGSATTTATLFVGGAMVLIGALLPRLVGSIRITPGSIEVALAERLDATRREARLRTPGLEDEAIARALEDLLPRLRHSAPSVDATEVAPGPVPQDSPRIEQPSAAMGRDHSRSVPPPAARSMGSRVPLVVIAVASLGLLGLYLAVSTPTGDGIAPPTGGGTGGLAVGAAVVLMVVGALAWRLRQGPGRHRTAVPSPPSTLSAEPPEVFARRIVDGLADGPATGQAPRQ